MNKTTFLNKMLHNYDVKIMNIVNSGNVLNNYTKKIYVINLEKNVIRKKYILKVMKKYGISFKLIIVKKINKKDYNYYNNYNTNISISELGCGLSHLWCLKDIIRNKYKNAIIFEDDIIFHKNFEAKFFNIIQRQYYDFLLLGACDYHFSEINHKNIHNNLYRPNTNYNEVYGAHAIYYSLKGAEYMFNNKLNEFAFFDYDFNKVFLYFDNTSFICYPNLVVTELTTSDNNHDFELFTEKENMFYSKCFVNFNFTDYNFFYLNLLDSFYINDFSDFKEYLYNLFKIKYNEKYKKYFEQLKKRIDFNLFSWDEIKEICNS
jgi:GR25 family glycosyltransferase involved in LPS biosynthesis